MSDRASGSGVLIGTRVVDLTQALAGPYCTMLLGDLGADVIKVERPGTGDQSRGWGPPYLNGESAYFLSVNRNKRGITLNLKEPQAQGIMHRLVRTADVFVVNQPRLSSLKKLGIDYETLHRLNPRLIYCSITGYGMTGPYAGRPGYDVVIQGEAGLMSLTKEVDGEPVRYPIPIADVTTGIYSALAILAALLARQRTGEGQFIDNSLIESQVAWLTNVGGNYFATGRRPPRLGNAHPSIVPYQPFRARDKHLIVGVGTERLWERFCRALGVQDTLMTDPRFATNADRLTHRDELIPQLEEILSAQDADHWLGRFREAGIPCGPINFVDEILNDPHIRRRGVIVELEHPAAGVVRSIANPVRLSQTPVSYRRPPPTLGQHNQEVLGELGIVPEAERVEVGPVALRARAIGRPLLAALREAPFRGRVWRCSGAACHLLGEGGRAVSLVTAEVGAGPLNVVVEGDAPFRDLKEGLEARIDGEQLTVGERLTVSLRDAAPWDATLRWGEIGGEALAALWAHVEAQATSESLLTVWVPSVRPLRGARMALVENARNAAEQLLLALHLGHEARAGVYVKSLAGLGPGVTPAGDDFLLGLMAGLRARPSFLAAGGLSAERVCETIVTEAVDHTHAFSVARLKAAQAGQMDVPWHGLAAALTGGDEKAIHQAADALLRFGATSGADALAGFVGPFLVSDLRQAGA
jgi:formyl-CoA transferase/CoA:oxalate CoA-transferase